MENLVSIYLLKFRSFCVKEVIEKKLYMYTGSDELTIKKKNFYISFINNDIFNLNSPLHKNFISEVTSYKGNNHLIHMMEHLRQFIISFKFTLDEDYLINYARKTHNFKTIEDACQVLTVLKLHFTWHKKDRFDGNAVSIFEKTYSDYADEEFLHSMILDSIAYDRLFCDMVFPFEPNHVFFYKASSNIPFDDFINYIKEYEYDGIILFTDKAFKYFLKFIEENSNNKKYDLAFEDEENGKQYLSFSFESKYGSTVITSYYKLIFIKSDDDVYKMIAYEVINHGFDTDEYRDEKPYEVHVCIDEKYEKATFYGICKVVKPTHIDIIG